MNRRRLKKALKRAYYLPQNKFLSSYLKNKIKHLFYKISKFTKVAYPSTLMIELTNHCNLSCTICPREYQYGKDMDKGRMSIELAKKIIDEEIPYLDSIGLTGMGETFMYNDLSEIVDYIKSKNKGVIISVSTNAVLPNFIEKVKPLVGKLDTIQISVDGLNEVYNSIRLNSNFDTLNTNIHILSDLCQSSSTDLMINMVVTKENYTQMPDMVKYAESIGVSYVDFTILN
ncbi:MAG TPA: radical SAM protein, partial [Tenuifilaceae bacterium]|nr:radical SAM protein [Tenuifilaceae bacterium]